MDERKVKQYLEAVFKLDGLEFSHNDGERLVFASPMDDVVVYKANRKVYDSEGVLIGSIDNAYIMD